MVAVLIQALTCPTVWADKGISAFSPAFKKETIYIATKAQRHPFQVEIAVTTEQLEHGLMGRTKLKRDHGMLFLWDRDEPVTMWMKDTPLSLDMLFIDKNGNILYMAENTVPNSTTPIGGMIVRAVLELPAGTVKEKRISLGDKVTLP